MKIFISGWCPRERSSFHCKGSLIEMDSSDQYGAGCLHSQSHARHGKLLQDYYIIWITSVSVKSQERMAITGFKNESKIVDKICHQWWTIITRCWWVVLHSSIVIAQYNLLWMETSYLISNLLKSNTLSTGQIDILLTTYYYWIVNLAIIRELQITVKCQ